MSFQAPTKPGALLAILLALGLVGGVFYALAYGAQAGLGLISGGTLEVGIGILVFAFLFYSSATFVALVTREQRDQPAAVFLNALLHVVFLCIGWFLLRAKVSISWLGFAAGFTIIVQGGTYAFALLRRHNIRGLLSDRQTGADLAPVEGFFRAHSATYQAIPLGAAVGTLISARAHASASEVLRHALSCVFGMIALAVIVYLVIGCSVLLRDFVVEHEEPTVYINHQRLGKQSYLQVYAPQPSPSNVDLSVDAACISADIRKIFLVNQFQQLAVLVMCTLAVWQLEFGSFSYQAVILGLLAVGFLVTQVPYFIGQLRTHDRVLFALRGERREETRERLHKRASAVPTPGSWVAFIGTGTMGGLAYKLFEGLVVGLVK
jgi:hypothetical protein